MVDSKFLLSSQQNDTLTLSTISGAILVFFTWKCRCLYLKIDGIRLTNRDSGPLAGTFTEYPSLSILNLSREPSEVTIKRDKLNEFVVPRSTT